MADLKVAIKLEADGTALVAGIRLSRDELRKLGEAAKDAANALGGVGGNVVPFSDTQRQQLRGLIDTLHPAAARARDLQQSLTLLDTAQKAGEISTRQHAAAVAELQHQHHAANQSAGELNGGIGALAGGFKALGAVIAVDQLVTFGRSAIMAGAEAEQLDRRLKSLVGSGGALQDTQAWLAKTADRLGTSVADMTDGYARFLTLAKGGLVTVQQSRDLTIGLRDAQAHFVADASRMGDVMFGLGQALASPIVHMEELNQVTEPLPGLLLDMDKAAALPAGGFRRLVNEGKVTSELFRDTLIKALKGYAGEAEKAASGVEGAWARLENARTRFMANVGRPALPGATSATDILTGAIDLGTAFTQWTKRGEQTATQLFARTRFDDLLADRAAKEKDLARFRGGAGGVYADRNAALAEQQIAGINAELDGLIRRTNQIAQATAANDGWAEMWGVAGDGINYVASAAEKLAGPLAIVADELDLIPGKSGLVTKAQAELAVHMGTLAKVAALPPEELKKLGLTSGDVAMMMDRLREKIDPVAKAIRNLSDETAALSVPAGWRRELYQALDKAQEDKGRPLTDDEAIGVTGATRQNQSAKGGDRVAQMKLEADAAKRLADARASGNQAAVIGAQAENAYHAELVKSGDETKAGAARTEVLRKGMADLSGEVGAQVTQTTRSARQMDALAAAYAKGGAAVAAVELANKIETETAKAGAGAHSALAQAITEEEKARRKLVAAQFDRDMVLQVEAAKALALAERDGARAVADAQVANAAAIQIEKEGVAVDSDRAKAIRAKLAEQAKWQESQGYNSALRQKDEELGLARLELSLQGEGETIRARTLDLARAELEIRRQFPHATDDEVAALLKKHDATLKIREEIQQQRGLWDEIGRLGERAFDRIGQAITEAFVQGKAATVDWGNVARAVMSEAIQAAIQLAGINPLKNWATGGNSPTLWSALGGGQPGAAGQSGGVASFSSLGNIASAGNAAYTIYTGGNTLATAANGFATSSIGGGLGLSTVTPIGTTAIGGNAAGVMALPTGGTTVLTGSGQAFVGLGGQIGAGLPFGALGGIGGGLIGTATNSKLVGGLSGAALGGGSAYLASILAPGLGLGPVGIAAAAVVAAVMAMLGTTKASSGPGGGGRVLIENGTARLGAYGSDDGYSEDSAKQLGTAGATLFNGVVQVGGGKLARTFSDQDLLISNWTKEGKFQSELDGQINKFDTVDEALIDGMRRLTDKLVREGKLAFDNPDYLTSLRNSKATKTDDFMKDLAVGAGFKDTLTQLNGSYDPRANWIKDATAQQKELGDQVKTNLIDWRDRAMNLGLATDQQLNPALLKGVRAMMGIGDAATPVDTMVSAAEQARIKFEAFRPALTAIGQTAEQQAALLAQYVLAAQDEQAKALRMVTRRGEWAVEGAINPSYRPDSLERVADYGIDIARQPQLRGLGAALSEFFRTASDGTLVADDLRGMWAQINRDLAAGRITADQYNTVLQGLTQTYQEATQRAAQVQAANEALHVRALRLEGNTAQADAEELRFRHQDELREAERNGYDATYMAGLRYVQGLEVQAAAIQRAAQVQSANESLRVRALRLEGNTAQADAEELRFRHQDELREAERNGYDATYMAGLRYVQGLEVQAAAIQRAATGPSWSDLLTRAMQEQESAWQQISSAARQAAQEWTRVGTGMTAANDNLLADPKYSNLSGDKIRDNAWTKFEQLTNQVFAYQSAADRGGATDELRQQALDAASQIDEAGKAYLDAARNYGLGAEDYDGRLTRVRQMQDAVGTIATALASAETARANRADGQVTWLQHVRDEIAGQGAGTQALLEQIKTALQDGRVPAPLPGVTNGLADGYAAWMTTWFGRYNDLMTRWQGGTASDAEAQATGTALWNEKVTTAGQLPTDPAVWNAVIGAARASANGNSTADWFQGLAHERHIPGFATGGDYSGGYVHMVGERGPELRLGGAARYWSAEQTAGILSPKMVSVDMAPVVTAVHGVASAVMDVGRMIADMAARLANVEAAVDGLARETAQLHTQLRKRA